MAVDGLFESPTSCGESNDAGAPVVGIGLASVRYRQAWLGAGAGVYALLLLGLLAPLLDVVFPAGGVVYPVLALPLLVLLAPALISHGSHHPRWTAPG